MTVSLNALLSPRMVMKLRRRGAVPSAATARSAPPTKLNWVAAPGMWALAFKDLPASRTEIARLENLLAHVDPRLQHALLLEDIHQRLVGVEIRVVELAEHPQIRLGQDRELIGADGRVFRDNRLVLVEIGVREPGGFVDDRDDFL